jgi:thiol-disulfide isomerase/thioredoxin
MRIVARLALVLLVSGILAGCIRLTTSGFNKGRPSSNIRGIDADGQSLQLSDYRGKVVLLKFWRTDCPPCRSLIPHERSLVQQYANKPFVLLGINTDETREQLQKTQAKEKLNWRSWWDGPSGPIAAQWKVDAVPTLYLIDHKGAIRFESRGVPDAKELEQRIEKLVHEAEAEKQV